MTTTRMTRCIHCNEVYPYHPSTYGFIAEYNDKRYCPECFEVITKALESVPVKFKKEFVDTADYTREEIVIAQESRLSEKILKPTRVMMSLFNLKDGSNQQHNVCEMMKDPVSGEMIYYLASWWSREPDKVEISKEIWWDLINNKPA